MNLTACILKPRGPLHLGEREGMREGTTAHIHSDTLFSAICHCLLLLYGRETLERFLAAEQGPNPPLRMSSAFPYWKEQFYFPVPRNLVASDKETKRLRFVPQSTFERLLAGELPSDLNRQGIPRTDACPWRTEDVPKVTLSRLNNHPTEEGGFYHVGLAFYEGDAGLFFLMDLESDEWRPKVAAALRLMCDEGIGGYRSVGKGGFGQPRFAGLSVSTPAKPDGWLSLSLYHPGRDELTGLGDGYYDLLTRSGYVFSPENRSLRRKTVRMFDEGSVFPVPERKGELADVTPDGFEAHKVWRYGLAFSLPCSLTPVERGA